MFELTKKMITRTAESFGYYIGILPPVANTVESHVVMICEKFGVNCLIDVGAHHGEYAKRMREAGYRGKIVSFEPVSKSYAQLLEASADDDDWEVINAGLGEVVGKMKINVTVGTQAASFLKPSEYGKASFGHKLDITDEEEVDVKTIDSVFDRCVANLDDPKVYLKVDAQGYDVQVFKGAEESLPKIVGLQTEMSIQPIYEDVPDYKTFIEALGQKGFSLSGVFPVRIDNAMKLIEMDCIMVRDNAD